MKEYNRTTKKYEEVTDIKLKKRELCRGQREHDYLLVLPDHITYSEGYKFNPEAYYKIMDELTDHEAAADNKIAELGITSKYMRFHSARYISRCYICSVCKKKKYER